MKILSFKRKNIVFASIILILAAMLISTINYMMSMNSTINRMTTVAQQTMQAWSPDVHTKDVEKLVKTHDETIQRYMISHFDDLGKYQPQVAQGYLFGVELANGTDTSVISAPTFLMNEFADSDLHIGSMYTQPQVIVDSIKKMKKSKKQTMSIIYTDSFGTWLTVLKPLFNEEGEMFAYYGIDFDASAYLADEYQKMATIIGIFVLLIVIIWLSQSFTMNNSNEQKEVNRRKSTTNDLAINDAEKPILTKTNFQRLAEANAHSVLANTPYLTSKKDLTNDLNQQANLINSTIQLITTIAKESKIMLLHAKTKTDSTSVTQLETYALISDITERSMTNSKLISRLIQEVQTATDKGVQLFQASTLLTFENKENKQKMTSLVKEVTTQTTFILKNIKEVHDNLNQIILANEQLTDLVSLSEAELNSHSATSLILEEINLFNAIVVASKSMKSTIQLLEKMTIDNK